MVKNGLGLGLDKHSFLKKNFKSICLAREQKQA